MPVVPGYKVAGIALCVFGDGLRGGENKIKCLSRPEILTVNCKGQTIKCFLIVGVFLEAKGFLDQYSI